MPLRAADLTSTRRFEDGDAWLELKVALTKGAADRVRDLTASYRIDPGSVSGADPQQAARIEVDQRTAQANRALFELLCVDWSLPTRPTGESYADLDRESGEWVDDCISEVLEQRAVRAVKNVPSSKRPSRRASSSAKAAG